MTKDKALRLALEALENNRRTHHYCEDTWYSCPRHQDGCANDSEGNECNCGADEANAGISQTITAIKAALEAKDEPVAWYHAEDFKTHFTTGPSEDLVKSEYWQPLYTTPPQPAQEPVALECTYGYSQCQALAVAQQKRLWVGLTDEETSGFTQHEMAVVKYVSKVLQEKNT